MCQKALAVSRGLLGYLCFAVLLGARSAGLEPATFSVRSHSPSGTGRDSGGQGETNQRCYLILALLEGQGETPGCGQIAVRNNDRRDLPEARLGYTDVLTSYAPSSSRTKVRFVSSCIRPTYRLVAQPRSIVRLSQLRIESIVHSRSAASLQDHPGASVPSQWSRSIMLRHASYTTPMRSSQAAATASSVSRAAKSALAIP